MIRCSKCGYSTDDHRKHREECPMCAKAPPSPASRAATAGEEEERLAEEHAYGDRPPPPGQDPGFVEKRSLLVGLRKGKELADRSGLRGLTLEMAEAVLTEKEAQLAAQAQAVKALEAERDRLKSNLEDADDELRKGDHAFMNLNAEIARLREDLRAAKEYADQAADNLLESAMEKEKLREALEKVAFGSVTYKIEGGFNQRNRTREEMQEVARAALELNSKPPEESNG